MKRLDPEYFGTLSSRDRLIAIYEGCFIQRNQILIEMDCVRRHYKSVIAEMSAHMKNIERDMDKMYDRIIAGGGFDEPI